MVKKEWFIDRPFHSIISDELVKNAHIDVFEFNCRSSER